MYRVHVLRTLLMTNAHGVLICMYVCMYILLQKSKPGGPDQPHYQALEQLAAAVISQSQLSTTSILGVRTYVRTPTFFASIAVCGHPPLDRLGYLPCISAQVQMYLHTEYIMYLLLVKISVFCTQPLPPFRFHFSTRSTSPHSQDAVKRRSQALTTIETTFVLEVRSAGQATRLSLTPVALRPPLQVCRCKPSRSGKLRADRWRR